MPTTVSCVLTGCELVLRRKSSARAYNRDKRASAVTVILLTTTTLACFLPRTILAASFLTSETTLLDRILEEDFSNGARYAYILTTGLALANSSINPLIFIIRSQSIRQYFCTRRAQSNPNPQPCTKVVYNLSVNYAETPLDGRATSSSMS